MRLRPLLLALLLATLAGTSQLLSADQPDPTPATPSSGAGSPSSFTPSERITAESAVSFPVDI